MLRFTTQRLGNLPLASLTREPHGHKCLATIASRAPSPLESSRIAASEVLTSLGLYIKARRFLNAVHPFLLTPHLYNNIILGLKPRSI